MGRTWHRGLLFQSEDHGQISRQPSAHCSRPQRCYYGGMKLIGTLLIAVALLQPAAPTRAQQIQAAAFDVMRAARYCTLITIGDGGQPQARIVDPLIAEAEGSDLDSDQSTHPEGKGDRARSPCHADVLQCRRGEYVAIHARATMVSDAARKAAHWKPEWQPFYKQQTQGPDFMVFEVRPVQVRSEQPPAQALERPGYVASRDSGRALSSKGSCACVSGPFIRGTSMLAGWSPCGARLSLPRHTQG